MRGDVLSSLALAPAHSGAYGWLMLAGLGVSLVLWSRLTRRDVRLISIYLGALAGAFLGAKLVYLAAEGWLYWHDPNRWLILATGKSITGALLGGYAGVETVKHLIGYRNPTGYWFAIIAPVSILIGRVGCVPAARLRVVEDAPARSELGGVDALSMRRDRCVGGVDAAHVDVGATPRALHAQDEIFGHWRSM